LQTGQDRRRSGLKERYYHQSESVRAEVAIGSPNDIYLLGPVLDEHAHNVETVVYLAVGIDQVRVVDGENVVDIEVYLKARFSLGELENWDPLSWDKNYGAFFSY
jgi:hypothetical protein